MRYLFTFLILIALAACSSSSDDAAPAQNQNYPLDVQDARKVRNGTISGDYNGFELFGPSKNDDDSSAKGGIGVNSFLWRASLDTISFMPIASADPFGGVIITDWYEDPATPGQRFKANITILDNRLRADGVRVALFKQKLDGTNWRDIPVAKQSETDIENAILTRARDLRVKQLGK